MKRKIILLVLGLIGVGHLTTCREFDSTGDEYRNSEVTVYQTGNRRIEKRKRIAVVDGGVARYQLRNSYMCQDVAAFSYEPALHAEDHGINIVSIISEKINSKEYCITSFRYDQYSIKTYLVMLKLSVTMKSSIINLSLAGELYEQEEFDLIKTALSNGAKINVAAGNNKSNLDLKCNSYPACYKDQLTKCKDNFNVIGSLDKSYSNFGKVVTHTLNGNNLGIPELTGTSQATALFTANMVKK